MITKAAPMITKNDILRTPEIRRITLLYAINIIWKDYKTQPNNESANASDITKSPIRYARLSTNLIISVLQGNLFEIPLDLCTNQYAFSYGNKGWHYFRDLANELMLKPSIKLEETRFLQFFQYVQQVPCSSYTKLMTFHCTSLMESLPKIPFGSYPWTPERDITIDSVRFYDTSKVREIQNFMWFEAGKESYDVLYKEFKHIVYLLNSFQLNGYRPILSDNIFPEGVILKNQLGDVRFIQIDGAHRLSVMSALGYDRVIVKLNMERYPPIFEEGVEGWPYVQSGLVSRADALRLFHLYFTSNGNERVNMISLS
jgi:hypothetical protein